LSLAPKTHWATPIYIKWGMLLVVLVAAVVAILTHMTLKGTARLIKTHRSLLKEIDDRKSIETERNRLESQIRQSQKLESLGMLAGGVAEDIQQLYSAILDSADQALEELGARSAARESVLRIVSAARQAAELSRQMLVYSGKGEFSLEPTRLNRFIGDTRPVIAAAVSKRGTVQYNLSGESPAARVDATQLRRMLIHLVANASEAIGEGKGAISVATGIVDCSADDLKQTWLGRPDRPGRYAYLEVSDTGCGIDREILPKIFDPFFTTKHTARGFGLPAVLGIVRGHQGAIRIDSEPGLGTTVRVLFPLVDSPEEEAAEDAAPEEVGAGQRSNEQPG
jgi:signal transduction histidine kinase